MSIFCNITTKSDKGHIIKTGGKFMEDKPRYSRNSDILELAFAMAARPQGVTIKDIEEDYYVSRRTAERMRDILINIFPQIE